MKKYINISKSIRTDTSSSQPLAIEFLFAGLMARQSITPPSFHLFGMSFKRDQNTLVMASCWEHSQGARTESTCTFIIHCLAIPNWHLSPNNSNKWCFLGYSWDSAEERIDGFMVLMNEENAGLVNEFLIGMWFMWRCDILKPSSFYIKWSP